MPEGKAVLGGVLHSALPPLLVLRTDSAMVLAICPDWSALLVGVH